MTPGAITGLAFGALTLWREARGEPREGKAAVAWTIVRRARTAGWWNGKKSGSIVAVVAAPLQYSSMTDAKDPQLVKFPREDDPQWVECLDVMEKVLAGTEIDHAPGSDSYYAESIKPPAWATDDKFVVQIGAHRFYRLLT